MRPSLSKAGRQVWLMVIGAAIANWEPGSLQIQVRQSGRPHRTALVSRWPDAPWPD